MLDASRRGFMKAAVTAGALATVTGHFNGEEPREPVASKAQAHMPFLRAQMPKREQSNLARQGSISLLQSMRLAGQNLLGGLCPKENYLPYWAMRIGRDYRASFTLRWPAHNIGRWMDAMLRLENATGFAIPGHIEGAMLTNVRNFFDNPDNLCLPPAKYYKISVPIEFHSLREGLLALQSLARYRGNRWAAEQGHRMLETVWRISRGDGGWELNETEAYRRTQKLWPIPYVSSTASNGRMIEALIWFYDTTGDPLALKLADRFARYHLANTTNADGTMNQTSHANHTHSYLGTLRGLLLFGEITNQREYIERVAVTYRRTVLGRLIKRSGFIAHDLATEGTAEPTSVGDVVQMGLWLARHGYTEFLDDSERLVRCRLLPCQITRSPGIRAEVDDDADEHRDLDSRIVGAYGGMHEPQWGKKPVTDITCAVLHSLIDVYQHTLASAPAGLVVTFHLDYEDDKLRIKSERAEQAKVTLTPKVHESILVRIPGWAPEETVRLTVDGKPFTPIKFDNFAYIPRDVLPGTVVLRHGLPVQKTVEKTAGVNYTFAWKGDEITGVTPNQDFFSFYPTTTN